MTPHITRDTVCVPSEDIVAREIEGEMIIVPLVSGVGDADDEIYALNETGKAILRKLDGVRTLGQVAETLAEEFTSSGDELDSDVLGFATEMIRRKILTVKI